MKIYALGKNFKSKMPVTNIDFKNEEVSIDLSYGNNSLNLNSSFENVELSVSGDTSDGYHTFDELYHHRMMLFAVICNTYKENSWKSKLHADGTMFNDYFIVGVTTDKGDYTYHYHLDNWDYFNVKEIPNSPKWDGHRPKDIDRLLNLIK